MYVQSLSYLLLNMSQNTKIQTPFPQSYITLSVHNSRYVEFTKNSVKK